MNRIGTMEDHSKISTVESPPPQEHEMDTEKQQEGPPPTDHKAAFKRLGFLDQFLALWILLAMIIGILLGNFVPGTGPALQRGKFVGVSIPIGVSCVFRYWRRSLN